MQDFSFLFVIPMAEKDIARKALMLLSSRKLLPTPDNYQVVYCEIAGTPNTTPFPDNALRTIAQALPANSPGQHKQKTLLLHAIGQSS